MHDELPLIVAGNRDEFHARPTQAAGWWPDADPAVLGGRDLQAGGTWLAIGRNGRCATVTNFRDAVPPQGGLRSRGELVTGFLSSRLSPFEYVASIDGDQYAGFNLLAMAGDEAAYVSNREPGPKALEPGIYAVANAALDTPWSKVLRSKTRLGELLASGTPDEDQLLRLLSDRERATAAEEASDHLPVDAAHAITAPFIVLPDYGTRCSTVLLRDRAGNVRFTEQRFAPDGSTTGRSDFSFRIDQPE